MTSERNLDEYGYRNINQEQNKQVDQVRIRIKRSGKKPRQFKVSEKKKNEYTRQYIKKQVGNRKGSISEDVNQILREVYRKPEWKNVIQGISTQSGSLYWLDFKVF